MKSLVFWGEGTVDRARELHARDAAVLLCNEAEADRLEQAGVPYRGMSALIGHAERERIDEAAIAWTKDWGSRKILDGRSFRELLTWKGVSLWWFAELYLHHSTPSPRYVRLIECFLVLLDTLKPEEVEGVGLLEDEALLLSRTCAARRIHYRGPHEVPRYRYGRQALWKSRESRWNTFKTLLTVLKSTLRRPPGLDPDARKTVLFLSHAAFWRERRDADRDEVQTYEHYFDRLIPQVAREPGLRPFVLAVGPRRAFRRRGLADRLEEWLRLHPEAGPYMHVNRYTSWRVFVEVLRASRRIRALWRRLEGVPEVEAGFSHRGVSFAELAEPDLAGTLLLQLPWAVRCYEEMLSALRSVQPALVCLYAESSGWGRAAVAACRAAGVPTLALQHGIIYPNYYSYTHGPDEGDCPRPDRTAVFGDAARRLLIERGHYPPNRVLITGSPKFDELLKAARRWDRDELRARLGVAEGERLAVVASRFRAIRETHQAIGSAFPALVRATESLPGVHGLVKPHPAEDASPYEAVIRHESATRMRVLPPGSDLLELLHAADVLVTVESLSAVEALVLGRPVLVLNMPTHLREMVGRGAALGVAAGEDPAPALRKVLFDAPAREALDRARERYLSDVASGVDGGATARIMKLIRETSGTLSMVGC